MATAPREHSPSILITQSTPPPPNGEQVSVEEGSGELDLIAVLRQAVADAAQPTSSILDAIADAARVLGGADGTALALYSKGIFVCRARSGNIAPPLGAPISSESGISGECLRTANLLVCHDAMSDPRVDADVCRSLGIRSVAAVPVHTTSGIGGILEAFAARPNAFDGSALNTLRSLAEIAAIAHQREEGPVAVPVMRTVTASVQTSRYSSAPLVPDEVLDSADSGGSRLLIVSGIGITLLLMIAVAWWSWHVPADEVSAEQPARAAIADKNGPANPPVVATVPKPGPGIVSRRSDRSPETVILLNAAELAPADSHGDAANRLSPENGTTKNLAVASSDTVVIEPPKVDMPTSAGSEQLAQLTNIAPEMPIAAPRISEGVTEPALIHKVAPTYPMQARSQRLSGKVVLSATVNAEGGIQDLGLVSGSPILAAAAENAVRQWRYRPAKLNGKPIAVQKQITILFTLP